MSEESRNAGRGLRNTEVTESIIAAAIAVHRELGPGFLESVYEQALAVEFALRGIAFVRQKAIPLILNFSSMPLTVKRVRRERAFENIDLVF